MPLSRAGLITLAIFTFMGNYGSFFWPLILIKSEHLRTPPIGMLYFDSNYGRQTNLIMAASVMNIIPLVILFVVSQRFLVRGIQLGAVSGGVLQEPLDDEGFTWLVGQYRYTLEQYSWDTPERGGRPDEEPFHVAQRELREETGMEAEEWPEILRMRLSDSVTDELAIVYLARGLKQGEAQPEDTERLQVGRMLFEEAYRMVCGGETTDAISVTAILGVRLMMQSGGV